MQPLRLNPRRPPGRPPLQPAPEAVLAESVAPESDSPNFRTGGAARPPVLAYSPILCLESQTHPMEIKLHDRNFTIPDECPLDGPKKSTLRRNLQEHGAESFLTSRKLSHFAGCLIDELVEAGAVVVVSKASGAATVVRH